MKLKRCCSVHSCFSEAETGMHFLVGLLWKNWLRGVVRAHHKNQRRRKQAHATRWSGLKEHSHCLAERGDETSSWAIRLVHQPTDLRSFLAGSINIALKKHNSSFQESECSIFRRSPKTLPPSKGILSTIAWGVLWHFSCNLVKTIHKDWLKKTRHFLYYKKYHLCVNLKYNILS